MLISTIVILVMHNVLLNNYTIIMKILIMPKLMPTIAMKALLIFISVAGKEHLNHSLLIGNPSGY